LFSLVLLENAQTVLILLKIAHSFASVNCCNTGEKKRKEKDFVQYNQAYANSYQNMSIGEGIFDK
jgi:hypothetical protein